MVAPLRVPLGLAVLMAERLRADLGMPAGPVVGATTGYAIGVADAALGVAGRLTRSAVAAGRKPAGLATGTGQAVLRQPAVVRASAPVRRLGSAASDRMQATVARGRSVATAARADALVVLRTESASGLSWVRGEVLPAVIDDLVTDPQVRELAAEQAHGVLTDAAHEVRRRSSSADARIEAGARRLFGAGRPQSAP